MIAGLHWTAWLLLVVAVGPGIALVVVFYSKKRQRKDG
jgi:hypothetical protein